MNVSGIISVGVSMTGCIFLFILIAEEQSGHRVHNTGNAYVQVKNNRPVVKIVEPDRSKVHPLNSLIRYSISVSDVEDGESKYDEIASDQVILELKFTEGHPENRGKDKDVLLPEQPELTLMKRSDCFTCHQFNSKLIGPSFQEIAKRYAKQPATHGLLAKRIREGSTGIWGEIVMPAHSDLTSDAAENVVDWILENGVKPDRNYLVGDEGTIKLEPPAGAGPGYFTLRGTYTDKGLPGRPHDTLTGVDVIILRYR